MASITTELAGILGTVQRPGDFHVTGTTEIFTPRLEVEGVGPIALPLLPVQAEQLIAIAERAPYGRGADLLLQVRCAVVNGKLGSGLGQLFDTEAQPASDLAMAA